MKRRWLRSALVSSTTPWAAPSFLCCLAVAIVIPVIGFLLGGAAMARGCGKRKAQGLGLFVTANASVLAYGALFAAIITRALAGSQ